MTLSELRELWVDAGADERFEAFVSWVHGEISNGWKIADPPIERRAGGTLGGGCASGYFVGSHIFVDASSDAAITVGLRMIQGCWGLSQDRWEANLKEFKKQRAKQYKEWEKTLKDKGKDKPSYDEKYGSYAGSP